MIRRAIPAKVGTVSHPWAERLSALIAEYHTSAETMPLSRLQELIDEAWLINQHSSRTGDAPDDLVHLESLLWLGFMDGRRDARPLEIEHAFRLRELEAKSPALDAERSRLRVDPAAAPPEPASPGWWSRVVQWFQTCRSRVK